MIELGAMCIDKTTGFIGIANARCEYVGGSIRIEVQPMAKSAALPKSEWFDAVRLSPAAPLAPPAGIPAS